MSLILALLLVALPAVAGAQSDPVVESRQHYRAAVQAYEAGDRSAYLEHARQAQALRPSHGGVTWALASALALFKPVARMLLRHGVAYPAFSAALKRWVPAGAANWVRRLRARTLRKAPALPVALRQELTRHFHEDIRGTSTLIGRSLEHWL